MAMSRKVYTQVAAIISKHRSNKEMGVSFIIDDLSAMFKLDNPNFNKDKFVEACLN